MFRAKNQQSPPGIPTFKMMDSRDQFVKSLSWKSLLHRLKKLYKNNSVMQHKMENVEKYIERKYGNITVLISTLPLLFCIVYCKINHSKCNWFIHSFTRHILIIINIESKLSRIQKHADKPMSPLTLAPFCFFFFFLSVLFFCLCM